jgi:expansin (peptidoglycan-binding protein)
MTRVESAVFHTNGAIELKIRILYVPSSQDLKYRIKMGSTSPFTDWTK